MPCAEEPEGDVMMRPPRDPKAPLLDGFIAWRTFFVTVLLVTAMLGNMQWQLAIGGSLASARASAMTTLVIAQCLYALNCRYVLHSSLTYRVLIGNPWLLGAIILNCAIQLFLIYTPAVQGVWGMTDMDGTQWGKVLLLAIAVFLIVELEKFLGPRVLQPCIRPLARAFHRISCVWCNSYLCRCLLPTANPSVTGLPTPSTHTLPALLSGPAAGQPKPEEAAEAARRDMRVASRMTSSRHVKAAPVKPEVQQFIAASRRNIAFSSSPASSGMGGGAAGAAAGAPVAVRMPSIPESSAAAVALPTPERAAEAAPVHVVVEDASHTTAA
ncbi:MAG: hypothetical protein EOO41_00120 [Methanobacteriota archaeon]|nr:MAG: hypothetical protein EOO41_00120 [Euryarchaeota archaeon]